MTMTFTGTLTHTDTKKHIDHHFDMPDDATLLQIAFDFAPHRADGADYNNQMSLSLFDPNGFRGARHNNRDQTVRLTEASASPGYLPGKLTGGQWTVYIDTHRILPPDTVTYTITVDISSDPITDVVTEFAKGHTASRGQGWYRGDLHGHTFHSDGKWDVPDFVQYGRDYKLDFVTLTDHNTVSALAQVDSLCSDDILTMGGMELTTYYGHALALGTRQWYEWRDINGQNMHDLAQAVMDSGAFYIIAHPRSPGDPSCTGCRWEFEEMMPGIATAVEIWNGPWCDYNEDSLQLYYQWLNAGHKLVATAGTDIHGHMPDDLIHAGFNVVFADDLTEVDILKAVRHGHLYLSSGPDLKAIAFSGGKRALFGETLEATDPVRLTVIWMSVDEGDTVRLIAEGKVIEQVHASSTNRMTWTLDEPARWYVAEIRAEDGILRAITNPIWIA